MILAYAARPTSNLSGALFFNKLPFSANATAP